MGGSEGKRLLKGHLLYNPHGVVGEQTAGPMLYLARCSGCGAGEHRCVGDLDIQVIIVYEWPSPLHFAGLEAVCESPDVGVPEEPTVGVVWGR